MGCRDCRIEHLPQAVAVDVMLAMLAVDVGSAGALRVAIPTPLPTVEVAPSEAPPPDSTPRMADAFDFAVAQVLYTGHKASQQNETAHRALGIAGAVELSRGACDQPAAVVQHAHPFRPRRETRRQHAARFVVLGAAGESAAALEHVPVLALTVLDSAFGAISELQRVNLQSLDLSRCTSLTKVSRGFLAQRKVLRAVQLPPSVTLIGDDFLKDSAVETLDLSHCTSLTQLGAAFLRNCAALRAVKLPACVSTVGARFSLHGCTALEHLDLSHCMSLTQLGAAFLSRCSSLRSVTLPPSVMGIGDNFLQSSTALESLDLSQCTSLTRLGDWFLNDCNALRAVTLPASVTTVGGWFLLGCTALESLDLSHCTSLTELYSDFLSGCTSLRAVALPASVTKVGDAFLEGCTALESVDLSHCTSLTEVGKSFLANCPALRGAKLPPSVTPAR